MLNGIYFSGEFYDINYIFIKNSQCTKTGGTQRNVPVPTYLCLTSPFPIFPCQHTYKLKRLKIGTFSVF